ncbi:MAG: hypothetical protein WC356_04545 [Candidatus Micrarchaeia archaeon]|jgi:hypothetical protein
MLNYKVFETNSYNDTATTLISSTRTVAQTFTPGISHVLTAVSLKLVDVSGEYADALVEIYATDADGKPTGAALTSGAIDPDDITESVDPHFVEVVLDSSIKVRSSATYAIVVSYSGGSLGWRYNESGTYTAGTPYTTEDGGTTWVGYEDGDLVFIEWGTAVQIRNAARVQLYPRGVGTYDQLQPRSGSEASEKANWMCVADRANAPDEEFSYVAYNLFDNTGFVTGEDEGVAGVLTGTSATWKTGPLMNGLWGDGTDFENEVEIGYLLKSPTDNAWYADNWKRIAVVKSIQGAEGLTFEYMKSGNLYNPCTEVWFYTPQKADATNLRYVNPSTDHYPNTTPMKALTGTWNFVSGSKKVYADGDGNAIAELISPCCVSASTTTSPSYSKMWGVQYVVSDNEFYLYDAPTYTVSSSTFLYCTFSQTDDLTDEDKATMWTKVTKKDSYILKTTKMSGDILQVDIVFRCALTDTDRLKQIMIATYDSSDEDKSNSWAHVESTYEEYSMVSHSCGTFTNVTGEIAESPLDIYYDAEEETGIFYPEIVTAGTFELVVASGKKTYVSLPGIGGQWYTEGTYTLAASSTGSSMLIASPYIPTEYTDAEIAIATNTMIESAMTQYGRVVFAPGTWKQYKADLCAGDYIHIGTNMDESGHGYIDKEDCDGSNDEVQWNAALNNYRYTMLGNNVTPGYYLEDYVIAGRGMGSLSDSTATAQPFVILNSVEVYGDEETLTPPRPTGISYLEYPEYQFREFRQTLSRPGGGAWSLGDINSLQAGIVLGNVKNPISGDDTMCGYEAKNIPCCTQIYADVFFWPSDFEIVTVGFTQYGDKVFDNGLDQWGLKVYDTNGLNLYTFKVYRSSIAVYFARGKQLLKGITGRLLHRRRTSSAMGRGRTSIGVAE